MKRRLALLVFLSVFGVFAVGATLSFRLLVVGLRSAQGATEERLRGIGLTLARSLQALPAKEGAAGQGLLRGVRHDCLLEDAYLLGRDLRPLAGRSALTLLRVDPDRALMAAAGVPSVGPAYDLDAPPVGAAPRERPSPGAQAAPAGGGALPAEEDPAPLPRGKAVLAGYFPVDRPGAERQVLVLEAGASFAAAPQALRQAAVGLIGAGAVLSLLCLGLLAATLRAAARERVLFAQAERGRALSQMAAMVTHEIRNPLGTIRAGVELLRELRHPRRGRGDADLRHDAAPASADNGEQEIFNDVLEEVGRLKELSAQFLELARDPPLQPQPCDLGVLCDELCAQLRREYPDRESRGGSAVDGAERLRIERTGAARAPLLADPDKLRQVLRNLLRNAAQAMDGRGLLSVAVTTNRRSVSVLVSDDGPGITGQLSRRLFEPFATTKEGGTGLGLVISRRIAEQHGGSLELLPSSQGAHFLLTVPRRPQQPIPSGERTESDG